MQQQVLALFAQLQAQACRFLLRTFGLAKHLHIDLLLFQAQFHRAEQGILFFSAQVAVALLQLMPQLHDGSQVFR